MLKHLGMRTTRASYVWPTHLPSNVFVHIPRPPNFQIRSQISLLLIISTISWIIMPKPQPPGEMGENELHPPPPPPPPPSTELLLRRAMAPHHIEENLF